MAHLSAPSMTRSNESDWIAEAVVVIGNKATTSALAYAEEHGIPCSHVPTKDMRRRLDAIGAFDVFFFKEIVNRQMSEQVTTLTESLKDRARAALGQRNLVLVGLMGVGKSSIGRPVAQQLGIPFVDTDVEIERVSRMTITELFAAHGELEFRALETHLIKRLLQGGPRVLSTGGGAFVNESTRRRVKRGSLSVWLKADLDVLWDRVNKGDERPLLKTENPKQTLENLMNARYPIYQEADLTVLSRDVGKDIMVKNVLAAIVEGKTAESKVP